MLLRSRSIRWLPAIVALLATASTAPAQLSWNITFGDVTSHTGVGFDDPTYGASRQATVFAALNYISSQIDARGTINMTVGNSLTDGTGFLAQAGSTFSLANGFQNGYVFQRATTGSSPSGSGADGTATYDFGTFVLGGSNYNISNSTAAPGSNEFDLYSLTLHEFTHALGFSSAITSTGQGAKGSTLGTPDTYRGLARFFQVGSAPGGPSLINSNGAFNTAQVSVSALTSNNIYFNGAFATAANGGNMVQIYAPNPFASGSSLSHTDPNGPGGSNSVMQPSLYNGTERRTYQPFEIGMLMDIGYNQYFWQSGNGNWGDNTSSTTSSPWKNIDSQSSLSPVGTITPNLVLTFNGSGSTGYTSTNNLTLAATAATNNDANRFLVNRVVLDSSSTAANTIASNGTNILRFDTTIGVAPEILQKNTGDFTISHPVELTNAGLSLTGDGTGRVTVSGSIAVVSGDTAGLNKSGASEFNLASANSYNGGTTIAGGILRVSNISGSATGTGAVTVMSGGILAGSNAPVSGGMKSIITGDVTVQSGGTIQPGAANAATAGQINFTGATQVLTFAAGSHYAWSLFGLSDVAVQAGNLFDQILVNNGNGVNLSGGVLDLLFNATTTPTTTQSFWQSSHQWTVVSVANGTNSTQFSGISNADFSGVGAFTLSSGVNGSVLLNFSPTPVPEPASVLLVGGLIVGGVTVIRRRRRQLGTAFTAAAV